MELTVETILYTGALPVDIIERCLVIAPDALCGRFMQAAVYEEEAVARLSAATQPIARSRAAAYRRMALQLVCGAYDPYDLSREWCQQTGTLVQALHEAAIILRVPPSIVREIAGRA
jgi:hypothetical protein